MVIDWREVYGAELVARVEALGTEAGARLLYSAMDSIASCPPWEQLGDATRSVWIARAHELLAGDLC